MVLKAWHCIEGKWQYIIPWVWYNWLLTLLCSGCLRYYVYHTLACCCTALVMTVWVLTLLLRWLLCDCDYYALRAVVWTLLIVGYDRWGEALWYQYSWRPVPLVITTMTLKAVVDQWCMKSVVMCIVLPVLLYTMKKNYYICCYSIQSVLCYWYCSSICYCDLFYSWQCICHYTYIRVVYIIDKHCIVRMKICSDVLLLESDALFNDTETLLRPW